MPVPSGIRMPRDEDQPVVAALVSPQGLAPLVDIIFFDDHDVIEGPITEVAIATAATM